MKWHRAAAAALLYVLGTQAFASCGSAFCPVNTSWDVLGRWTEPGARFDLRYEAITQDQPRTGTRDLAVGEIPRHHDEVRTRNRNWVATFDYAFDADWGLTASLPAVGREHEHIHNHRGERLLETWNFTQPGDLRLLGRYQLQGAHPSNVYGLVAGVKLPFLIRTLSVSPADTQIVRVEKVESNATIDAAKLAKPAPRPAAGR